MPHASGSVGPPFGTGAVFQPSAVPPGIDGRDGFVLTKHQKTEPNAKDDYIDVSRCFGKYLSQGDIEFDYDEIETGGDMKAGWYYGVKNLVLVRRIA
jgi:hypothetical protein